MRILGVVLLLVFTVELAVMFVLPHVIPDSLGDAGSAFVDALLLTLVCAPVLWMVIIGPLRRIAIQEYQRSQTIVANASESILTFDLEGKLLSCNRAATELFGVDMDSLLRQSIQSLLPGLPEIPAQLPAEFRVTATTPTGGRFPIQLSISDYPSDSAQMRIGIVRDLTQAEKAEQERVRMARETEALRAQQMATLAQLATGVAHEIRNPLTSIKMLIQVNRTKFADEGLPTDDLELVEQEIRRMERSVNSLLDYARPETSEFREFPIQNAIRSTAQLIEGRCQAQHVNLDVSTLEDPMLIYGDAAQIQQLLLNLALNGLDAMPNGGVLTLCVTTEEDCLRLSVCDTGSGIDESVVDKLFTPFVTTKANGVGLGLGICRRIAEAHGGTLVGMNRASGGAKFELSLPTPGANAYADAREVKPNLLGHSDETHCEFS
ncbi:sensor histidine kinase [Planctomycetaceae bacterium SH139]